MISEKNTDILIVGASVGGVAAALSALRMGYRVVITEETTWIGGQLTAQGTPPDENPWIDSDQTGCTASYRAFREGIRDYYRRYYPLTESARNHPRLNPGMGNVSPLCHEAQVSLAVLNGMLAPYRATERLTILLRHRPIAAENDGDSVRSVTLENVDTKAQLVITAPYIIDATELGDLLELANVEHVIGAESQAQTGEMHALPDAPDPLDQQAVSWCFLLEYHPGEDYTINKPEMYDFWSAYKADFWPAKQLSWTIADPETLAPVTRPIFRADTDLEHADDLWHYRRVLYRRFYPQGFYKSDIIAVNWPQIDYWLKPLVGVDESARNQALHEARQLSLSMLHWMQTEAPRPEGGSGYPGLRPRGDLLGSTDDLAQAPYIRESRRIKAEFTVLEQHVGVEARGALQGAEQFPDTVGIGSYRIDLHPSYRRNYVDITNWPHQIPLGALIPQRVDNLLPGCKNLGVTHITNGCYRLHPIEWNIGEAVGALAAYCIKHELTPRQVRNTPKHLADFQTLLTDQMGFVLAWPEHLRLTPRTKLDPLGI